VRSDLERIVQMWSGLLEAHGGPMLFGEFTIADAYFAPIGTRIKTYGLPVPAPSRAYIERVQALPGVKAWIDERTGGKGLPAVRRALPHRALKLTRATTASAGRQGKRPPVRTGTLPRGR
jgi:glutathione S-transferase